MSRQPAFTQSDDDTWVDGTGIVCRLLHDDRDDSKHQRFVLDMRNGQTLLIAHNTDLARRVPLGVGDRIKFRGLYEWNDLGGMTHWTHQDPHGIRDGGYIKFAGREYS